MKALCAPLARNLIMAFPAPLALDFVLVACHLALDLTAESSHRLLELMTVADPLILELLNGAPRVHLAALVDPLAVQSETVRPSLVLESLAEDPE